MNRNCALDVLKMGMALMVVGLHTNFLRDVNHLAEFLTVNGLFRIAVPLFLIINGYFFFPVLENNRSAVWLKRVFILFAFWTLVYSYFWVVQPSGSWVGYAKLAFKIAIGDLHLWYISAMLCAALLLIFLATLPMLFIVLSILVTFVSGVAIQYLGNYHWFNGSILDQLFNYDWSHRNFLFFAYPFFCIGYLIHKFNLGEKVSLSTAVGWSLIGLLLLACESYGNYRQPNRDGGFDNFASLIVVCPAIFIGFMKLDIKGNGKLISLYSSAIFFTHFFLLKVLNKNTDLGETALALVVIPASVVVSFFVIQLNKKLKFIL